jgi:hypothetical protein
LLSAAASLRSRRSRAEVWTGSGTPAPSEVIRPAWPCGAIHGVARTP